MLITEAYDLGLCDIFRFENKHLDNFIMSHTQRFVVHLHLHPSMQQKNFDMLWRLDVGLRFLCFILNSTNVLMEAPNYINVIVCLFCLSPLCAVDSLSSY